jgi:hypothetical protein
MKKFLLDFKGPFFKEDGFIDYVEAHSFVLGVMSGMGRKKQEQAFQRDKKRMDHTLEWQYWTTGYRLSNKGKWAGIGGIGTIFGPEVIQNVAVAVSGL